MAGASLRVIGDAPAGTPFGGSVTPGTAVRIATGGVVPQGADRIVIQEIVERDGDRIRIVAPPGPARYVRPAGCDFAAGQLLAARGRTADAGPPRPRRGRQPGRAPGPPPAARGHLRLGRRIARAGLGAGARRRSSIRPLMRWPSWSRPGAASRSATTSCPTTVPDARSRFAAPGSMPTSILPLGGASVGERDVLRPVLQGFGAQILFERIAVQPGKPCWHARFADGRLVLGLPGNPASAFVCAHLLLKPLMLALLGRAEPDRLVCGRLDARHARRRRPGSLLAGPASRRRCGAPRGHPGRAAGFKPADSAGFGKCPDPPPSERAGRGGGRPRRRADHRTALASAEGASGDAPRAMLRKRKGGAAIDGS